MTGASLRLSPFVEGPLSLNTPRERMKMLLPITTKPHVNPISSWPHTVTSDAKERRSTSQAPLALELEAIIRRELHKLTATEPHPTILQTIPVFREAFNTFIGHFPEYASVLSNIKREYDAGINELTALNVRLYRVESECRTMRDCYEALGQQETKKSEAKYLTLKHHMDSEKLNHETTREEKKHLENLYAQLKAEFERRSAEFDEQLQRNHLLTCSIRDHSASTARLVADLNRLKQDNERLHHICLALESKLTTEKYNVAVEEDEKQSPPHRPPSVRPSPASNSGTSRGVVAASGKAPLSPQAGATPRIAAPTRSPQKLAERAGSPSRRSAAPTPIPRAPLSVVVPTASVEETPLELEDGDGPPAALSLEYATVEDLREVIFSQEHKIKRLQRNNVTLQQEVQTLQQRLHSLSCEGEQLTPRPKWGRTAQLLPDFHPNQLQTSEEILEDLLRFFKDQLSRERREAEERAMGLTIRSWLGEEDLCESDLSGKGKCFIGRGTGPNVPVYLRYHGFVRNKHMKKGETERLLKKFWAERQSQRKLQSVLTLQPLPEFYHEWLVRLTGSFKSAIELAYNMIAVCEAYQSDPDCSMFLRIIRGEISEGAIFDQLEQVDRLKEVAVNHDKQKKGYISRLTVHRIMNKYFCTKSFDDILKLRFALIVSCRGRNIVDYNALFAEDEDGNQTRFVEMIREQYLQEVVSFVVDIEEALRKVINSAGKIDMGTARTAIRMLDPLMPHDRIEEILAYGCRMTVDDLGAAGEGHTVPAEDFLCRLRGVLIKPYSRRDGPPARDGSGSEGGEANTDDEDALSRLDHESNEPEGGQTSTPTQKRTQRSRSTRSQSMLKIKEEEWAAAQREADQQRQVAAQSAALKTALDRVDGEQSLCVVGADVEKLVHDVEEEGA